MTESPGAAALADRWLADRPPVACTDCPGTPHPRAARVWDTTNARLVCKMVHEDPVLSLAFRPDGTYEVNDRSAGVVTRGISASQVSERAQHTFEDAIYRVQPAMHAVVSHIQSAAQSPNEIQVEFGLNLHAEAGAFIAAAGASANFTVTLTWHRDDPRPRSS